MSSEDSDKLFKAEWYFIAPGEKEPRGPLSYRDLDVFFRTNALDSNMYVWKEGFPEWKKIYMVDELKDLINISHSEITESIIRTQIQNAFNGQKFDSAKKNFYFSSDGLWHVYNPFLKIWTKQDHKPEELKKNENSTANEKNKGTNENENAKAAADTILSNSLKENIKNLVEKNTQIEKSPLASSAEIPQANTDTINNPNNQNNQASAANQDQSLLKKKRKFGENIEKILTDEQIKLMEKKKKKLDKLKEKKKEKWYASKLNANIYISGLPKDITEFELTEYFSRCGFIRKDPKTNQNKIKIYKDANGKNKGDALVSFLREESVSMAIDLFNDAEIRPGYRISVEPAKFEQKGDEYKKREAYKIDELQRFKMKTDVERMLGWNEDEDNEKGLKIVILKNMFEPIDFIEDPGLRQDLELDIIEECEEKFGKIEKLKIFEDNINGIIKIRFHSPVSADKCIQGLNGRFYNGKTIEAFFWDGKTDYDKQNENSDLQDQRIEEFGKWLENQELEKI